MQSCETSSTVFLNLFCYLAPLVSYLIFGGTPTCIWQNRSKDQWIAIIGGTPGTISRHPPPVENQLSIPVFLNRRVTTYLWVAITSFGSPKLVISLLNGSPDCILYCFVGRQLPKVENHWSILMYQFLSNQLISDSRKKLASPSLAVLALVLHNHASPPERGLCFLTLL